MFLLKVEKYTSKEILQNMQVKKGMPILNLDTDAILKNKNLPWVKEGLIKESSQVRYLFILKRSGNSIMEKCHEFWLIDQWGCHKYKRTRWIQWPILISGIDAPRLTNLIQIINLVPNLAKNVQATRVGARRWDVFLKDGTKIMLPESGH